MKKINHILFIALGAIAAVSCNNELEETNNITEENTGSVISFKAVADTPTKATLTDDYDANYVFRGAWEEHDAITVDYGENDLITALWDVESECFRNVFLRAQNDLYAYYPETKDGCYPFSGSGRKQEGNKYNSYFDLMYSDKFNLHEGENDIIVPMHRATAIQYFHLTADESAAWANLKVQSATLTVTGDEACIASSEVLIGNDGTIVTDDTQNSITISFYDGDEPTANDVQLWFNVLPCHVESMTITVELEDGYTWTKTNTFGGKGYTFEAGQLGYVKGAPVYTSSSIANTLETAYTVEEAIDIIKAGRDLDTEVYVKGTILSIAWADLAKYGNADITLISNGEAFKFYRCYDFDEAFFTEKYLKAKDEIIAYGKLTTHGEGENLVYELAQGCYLVDYKEFVEPVTSITLPESIELETGSSYDFAPVVKPSNATYKELSWTSNNSDVVSVDESGHAIAKAAGSAIVTTTSVKHPEISASCKVTVKDPIEAEPSYPEVVYDFSEIDFSDGWSQTYGQHTVDYTDAKVTFNSANKNTSTITDIPVTKGEDVVVTMKNNARINSVVFVCEQWTTKSQKITLFTSADGSSFKSTDFSSDDFTLSADNLGGVKAVRFSFSSSSNQVGISKLYINCEPEITTYSVNIASGLIGGTIAANTTSAAAGTTITLTAKPDDNYEFVSWNVTGATVTNPTSTTTSFKMPAGDVNVSASFKEKQGGENDTWTRCTSVSDLTSGGTFIIGYEETAKSGKIIPMKNNGGTATTSAAGYMASGSEIDMATVTATSDYEFTIVTSTTVDGAVCIKYGDNFIGNTNTKNNLKLFTEEANTTSFGVTVGAEDVFIFKIAANNSYHTLQYNTSSPRFAVYGGTQKNLVVYKKN